MRTAPVKPLKPRHLKILAILRQGHLTRQPGAPDGSKIAWVFGAARFSDATVALLLAHGVAFRDGDTVRVRPGPGQHIGQRDTIKSKNGWRARRARGCEPTFPFAKRGR